MRKKEILRNVINISSALGLFLLAFTALSKKQRKWVLDRDNHQCQFPVYDEKRGWHVCGSRDRLQTHHLCPQRWGKAEGKTEEELDDPYNLLTLCYYHHQVFIHPDMELARKDYGRQKKLGIKKPDSFKWIFKKRDEAVKRGEHYWNDDWDKFMKEIARERTDNAIIRGRKYPKKRKRK